MEKVKITLYFIPIRMAKLKRGIVFVVGRDVGRRAFFYILGENVQLCRPFGKLSGHISKVKNTYTL